MVTQLYWILTLVLATGFMVSLSVFMVWIAPSVVAETRKKKQPDSWRRGLSKKTLHVGGTYTLTTKEKGKFGRYIGVIQLTDKTSVNGALVKERFAVAYYGQSKDDILAAHLENRRILKERGVLK
jgi:hypothetical protein